MSAAEEDGAGERLAVVVRVRPLLAGEGDSCIRVLDGGTVVLEEKKRAAERRYDLDAAFGEASTHEDVYKAAGAPVVRHVLSGKAGAVFAYGPTGSGKTYTMAGLMERALSELFRGGPVSVSYLELYNERIRDLLQPSAGYLELREDGGGFVQVAGLTEVLVHETKEGMQLLERGGKARTVEPTALNRASSRSHALLCACAGPNRAGRLYMVDLAGSERAVQGGPRQHEGARINRSLLALGNCINALAAGARYVNYRDSKLTRLLKEVLGGGCRTVMVAHVSPGTSRLTETRATLEYAARAARIPPASRDLRADRWRTAAAELRDEALRLRAEAEAASLTARSGLRDRIIASFDEQTRLRRELADIDCRLLALQADEDGRRLVLSRWESRRNRLYAPVPRSLMQEHEITDDDEEPDDEARRAWSGLEDVRRERDRLGKEREAVERKLEDCRRRGAEIEAEALPTERELLALVSRAHELEADRMALRAERLARDHELRRRDLRDVRHDRQRQLAERIIARQRDLIEAAALTMPPDLAELYTLYQQEIHVSAAYEPIGSAPSSADSDSDVDRVMGHQVPPFTAL